MSLIDNDLLSIQEARILLEHANESVEVLEGLPASLVDDFLHHLGERLLPRAEEYAEASYAESDYCSPYDEAALTKWVLTDLMADVCAEAPVQKIIRSRRGSAEVCLSKGVVVSLLPEWLAVPTMLSQLFMAVRSKSPIVFSASSRIHSTCERVMNDILEIADFCHYPAEAIGFLSVFCAEGEEWVCSRSCVHVVIDSREEHSSRAVDGAGKDVYHATLGNNPVFVESTADLASCADEVVLGKSFCCGMLPGAEQSVVVERDVDERFQEELRQRGCHFLTDEQADRLVGTLFAKDGTPYRELIAKSAFDLARRADITVPKGTKVLVVEKPYVSEYSFFSKAKFGPVLSYYVEDSWRTACEKCIELILNSGHGNALSIFSRDPEVIRQFILKKPVGRVLVNVSTGLGCIGCHSDLPKTLTVTGWDCATTSELGVTYGDFVRRRQVGIGAGTVERELLDKASACDHTPVTVRIRIPDSTTASRAEPASKRERTKQGMDPESWFSGVVKAMQGASEEE
ncbi:acyl-CoA reductase-like NAD-dependent aldehyde dehydrogenase [Olsenella profusa DSM 13989]|uniref:Aldehyde dehydrogenase (NAD) domain protein n=1 Tax=Olsenella profusa F0195 TaxID=1125712 RepID=U2TKT0_9ACTN|nr:aldehyde dehydrogenase (NAD) domain protein [Olsenella profusa]ERL06753.1 aldehyde dehydrogenase (NAD) domain protein [Olsenella profusa F0195]MDP9858503.1 acyl-CoA reductase-like NAD-dependent aldehyde dehydrogenase [Olsenella profusa DSM 13989]